MSKFKVIEESRFLNNEGMNEVRGGACETLPGGAFYGLTCKVPVGSIPYSSLCASTYNPPELCNGAMPEFCALAHNHPIDPCLFYGKTCKNIPGGVSYYIIVEDPILL